MLTIYTDKIKAQSIGDKLNAPQTHIELLDKRKHSAVKVGTQNYTDAMFHANIASAMPIEFRQLVLEYPIFITQSPNSKKFQFSILLGLEPGQNLYIENGKWKAKFLPLDILRRPFNLIIKDNPFDEEALIAIDTKSTMVNEEKGSSLFNNDGSPTKFFQRIKAMFSELMKGAKHTAQMLTLAENLGLIQPVSIEYEINDQPYIRGGMFDLSTEKIDNLNAEQLLQCKQLGLLEASVLMETSRIHVNDLINKAHPTF
ncbi:SapC family protein [Glaciecola sp. KUL10]|uniref:SapC family protein n=1 Tax=Glaciecola sp. (strain KUL10) TaxID=2161813 RepID=UPI000D783949|nr:SapC family protein [Glaciecola sp. KUL10]GBL05291.1 hypothetical protein KUL10_26110 [Glaciecola sp. KUL10]